MTAAVDFGPPGVRWPSAQSTSCPVAAPRVLDAVGAARGTSLTFPASPGVPGYVRRRRAIPGT